MHSETAAGHETAHHGTAPIETTMPIAATGRPARYAWYVLAILFLANCFNAMDRSIVTILVEPIKHDLGLNDTQIGIITGFGYALVYTLVSIAIARIVDRGNRKQTLSIGIAFWSVMTAVTGQTIGFWSMLGARFGIAAGEATCYPNALSLIGDYFERTRRPRAIAIFQLGTYGGIIFGVSTAGVLAAHYGWRSAFHLLGLPGLALAAIIWLTVKEPPRGMSDGADGIDSSAHAGALPYGGVAAMWRLVIGDARFGLLLTAAVLMAIAQVTMGSWVPAFLMRLHGVGQEQVGLLAGPIIGLSGVAGTLIGGFAGTRLAQRHPDDERAPLKVMLVSAPLAIPGLLLFLFAPTLPLTLLGGAIGGFFIAMHFGPLVAVTIGIVGASNRGVASSVLVIGQFLIGFGLGPLIVGALSDLIEPSAGTASLRLAMLLAPIAVGVAWFVAYAGYRRLGSARPA